MTNIAKKRLLNRKYSIFWAPSKKQNQRKPVDQSLQKERVKKTKYELETTKIVDCFPDGYGKKRQFSNFWNKLVASLAFFATPKILKRWSGSANQIVITAIISPIIKEPRNRQAAPNFRQKNADSSHSTLLLTIFMPELEKQIKKHILNQKFDNASDFESKVFRLVGFWNELFITCQISNQKISVM